MSLPLVPYLWAFILGVHFAFQAEPLFKWLDLVLACCLLVYFSLISPLKWGTLMVGACFFILGEQVGRIDQKLPRSHFTQWIDTAVETTFEISLKNKLRATNTQERYYAEVHRVNQNPCSGTLLLILDSRSSSSTLHHKNKWLVKGWLSPINAPLNPGEFNYKTYLQGRKITHQLYSNVASLTAAEPIPFSFQRIQAFLLEQLAKSGLKPLTIAVLETILLGERGSLDPSTRDQFAKAGVVHLFAISGLHIGLLMLFFQSLFRPLSILPHGRLWQNIGVLCYLWMYAFIVGGTASVIRSVTLFSAYQIGQNSGRKLPTTYLVFLSMGVLLFIRPRFILQLGFQMSYLAVFGILYLSPLLRLNFNHKLMDWFWRLTTVSLAAQIAVAPLNSYHFHQFPGLFLLSNWVILPFMGVFLYVSLGILIWLFWFPLPTWVKWMEDSAVTAIVDFVEMIAAKEAFVFQNIYFDRYSLYLIYACLIGFFCLLKTKKALCFLGNASAVLLLYLQLQRPAKAKLWIGHAYKKSLIVSQNNKEIQFYSSDRFLPNARIIQAYKSHFGIHKSSFKQLKNAYQIGSDNLLIIDGPWVFDLKSIPEGYWLLQKNAKINLARCLERVRPKKIIIDGSNSPFYIKQWTKTIEQLGIPYHITGKKGAIALTLGNAE